ncbi:MAG: hypothetical protein V7K47_24955 [Nostoc sp.]
MLAPKTLNYVGWGATGWAALPTLSKWRLMNKIQHLRGFVGFYFVPLRESKLQLNLQLSKDIHNKILVDLTKDRVN